MQFYGIFSYILLPARKTPIERSFRRYEHVVSNYSNIGYLASFLCCRIPETCLNSELYVI